MAPPRLLRVALRCRCPRCGEGKLYSGLLTVRESCPVCGLDLRESDTGDGATVFVMFFLCILIVGMALWVDVAFAPPLWVHAVLWPVPTLVLAIVLMRPVKAAVVALQYRHRASEMGL